MGGKGYADDFLVCGGGTLTTLRTLRTRGANDYQTTLAYPTTKTTLIPRTRMNVIIEPATKLAAASIFVLILAKRA